MSVSRLRELILEQLDKRRLRQIAEEIIGNRKPTTEFKGIVITNAIEEPKPIVMPPQVLQVEQLTIEARTVVLQGEPRINVANLSPIIHLEPVINVTPNIHLSSPEVHVENVVNVPVAPPAQIVNRVVVQPAEVIFSPEEAQKFKSRRITISGPNGEYSGVVEEEDS